MPKLFIPSQHPCLLLYWSNKRLPSHPDAAHKVTPVYSIAVYLSVSVPVSVGKKLYVQHRGIQRSPQWLLVYSINASATNPAHSSSSGRKRAHTPVPSPRPIICQLVPDGVCSLRSTLMEYPYGFPFLCGFLPRNLAKSQAGYQISSLSTGNLRGVEIMEFVAEYGVPVRNPFRTMAPGETKLPWASAAL